MDMDQNIINILITDDDQGDRHEIKRLLKQSGLACECTEVVSVEEAIKACDNAVFHCVIIDYQLTGQNGLEGMSLLHSQFPEMPIIMLTGHGNEMIAIEAVKRGASDYIAKKNLNADLLRKSITDAIEKCQLEKKIKKQTMKIDHMAHYDYLTKIPNRQYFSEMLSRTLNSAKRHRRILAVLLLDLDRFKNVNDELGHEMGDLLLKQAARRFQSTLRGEDILARLGGDEFIILLGEINKREDAELVAQKLIFSLKEPFLLGNETVSITSSIGIATYPFAGETVVDLIRSADQAMYKAKKVGKNNFQFYMPEFNRKLTQRLRIENALQNALKNQEFYLCYQPIYHLNDSSLFAIEALLRWNHPEFVDTPIKEIISVSEELGSIVPMGDWIMNEAFRQYKEWKLKNNTSIKLSLNIAPQQLLSLDWFSKVGRLMEAHQIDPRLLIFELTETDIVKNMVDTQETLTAFTKIGVQIFIDDFGMGYSTLNMLKNFTITGIKIDKSIVNNISDTGSNGQKVLESLFLFAEKIGFSVIAEGVETKTQLDFLKSYTKEKCQGYYLSKPLSPDDMAKLLYSTSSQFEGLDNPDCR